VVMGPGVRRDDDALEFAAASIVTL
jgi:hypothetical protein